MRVHDLQLGLQRFLRRQGQPLVEGLLRRRPGLPLLDLLRQLRDGSGDAAERRQRQRRRQRRRVFGAMEAMVTDRLLPYGRRRLSKINILADKPRSNPSLPNIDSPVVRYTPAVRQPLS